MHITNRKEPQDQSNNEKREARMRSYIEEHEDEDPAVERLRGLFMYGKI